MKDSIIEQIQKLENASDDELEKAGTALCATALANPEEFATAVRDIPLDQMSLLYEIYEAIAPSAPQFSTFLLEEVDRLFDALENPENKSYPKYALEGMSYIKDDAVLQSIDSAMIARSSSEFIHVRRTIAWRILDYAEALTTNKRTVLLRYIQDSDWRVRVYAHLALSAGGGNSLEAQISIFDRLRMKLQFYDNW